MPIYSAAQRGFVTTTAEQKLNSGLHGDYLEWVERIGARLATIDAEEHDRLCAWISHLPQMISTALASTLVDEFGRRSPALDVGGRALREMTRISSSPYSMWRDIAVTNKKLGEVMQKLEQRLAHIRENLDSRQLAPNSIARIIYVKLSATSKRRGNDHPES